MIVILSSVTKQDKIRPVAPLELEISVWTVDSSKTFGIVTADVIVLSNW